MAEIEVKLSDEERQCLVNLLEWTLRDALVEEHRTRTPAYRQGVLHREDILRSVLEKLRP